MIKFCARCVSPCQSGFGANWEDEELCGGCRVWEETSKVDWEIKWDRYRSLIDDALKAAPNREYDVVVGVSGGKDSYFLVHHAIELGLRPLLVTYYGNNYSSAGNRNLFRMADVFGSDHLIVRPSVKVIKSLNRLGFAIQGDMNWHNHCGIDTVPVREAVRRNIPLIFYGEHGFTDMHGMYKLDDEVELTLRGRVEHSLRGYDWHDFTRQGLKVLGWECADEMLQAEDLRWAMYPTDKELTDSPVRALYQNFYMKWDGYQNFRLASDVYSWEESDLKFTRTYRTYSNVDDIHENGIHDYLKFIKLGYGRATDHSSKDVRAGRLTRREAIEIVMAMDHLVPSDLARWESYTGIPRSFFLEYCDSFRDPAVWSVNGDSWIKLDLDGNNREYGKIPRSLKSVWPDPDKTHEWRTQMWSKLVSQGCCK